MKPPHYLIYGLILFLPYFLRPDLVGHDSYFYLAQICRETYIPHAIEYNAFIEILPLIPCDIVIIKLILLTLFLISLFTIQKIGETFYFEHTGFLVLLSPILLLEFLKFENEAFAFPFLMAATYYFFRLKNEQGRRLDNITLCIFLLIVSIAFWKGALLYAVALFLPYSVPLLVGILWFYPGVHTSFLPSLIPEMAPAILLSLAFLIMGFTHLDLRVKFQAWFFLALGFLQNRFLIHALPYLAIGLETRLYDKWGGVRKFLYYMPFIWILAIFLASPTPGDWELVDSAIDLHNETGKPLYNEWGFGYWFHYKGLDANYFGWEQPIPSLCPGIQLKDGKVSEC